MSKICKVCGKSFEPYRDTNKYCSKECRLKNDKIRTKEFYEYVIKNDPDRLKLVRDRSRNHYRNKVGYKDPVCKICGEVIKHSNPNQKYHEECVLRKILETENTRDCNRWKKILYSKGYLVEEINDRLEEIRQEQKYK